MCVTRRPAPSVGFLDEGPPDRGGHPGTPPSENRTKVGPDCRGRAGLSRVLVRWVKARCREVREPEPVWASSLSSPSFGRATRLLCAPTQHRLGQAKRLADEGHQRPQEDATSVPEAAKSIVYRAVCAKARRRELTTGGSSGIWRSRASAAWSHGIPEHPRRVLDLGPVVPTNWAAAPRSPRRPARPSTPRRARQSADASAPATPGPTRAPGRARARTRDSRAQRRAVPRWTSRVSAS